MSDPDVSIVVPAWGAYAGRPLGEALESLRGQDVPARIIVVDNASDTPVEVPAWVELVRTPARLTVGGARNVGLERVTTRYVLFWDADDLMLPGTLRFLRDRIEARPDCVAVAASILDDDGRTRHRWPPRWSAGLAARRTLFACMHSVWSLFPSTGATIMRTGEVRACGGYADAVSGEDWVLGASLAFRGAIELTERPGRVYRRLGASLWDELHSRRNQLRHAEAVRVRLRSDGGVPRWARAFAPMLVVPQAAVVLLLGPLARLARRGVRR